jgi:hypothetical protein
MNMQSMGNGLRVWIFSLQPCFFRARIVERFGQHTLSPTKSEGQATSKHVDFRLKERMPTYTRVGNMDSTNVKIFSVVAESFEKK